MRQSQTRLPMLLLVSIALAAAAAGAQEEPAAAMIPAEEKIVNGLTTHEYPSVVTLLERDAGVRVPVCSGTLIGCRTVLTAAHCVCGENDDGASCRPDVRGLEVFLQHAGTVAVSSAAVHPRYDFDAGYDLAVLRLAESVSGVAPSPIQETGKPGVGAIGTLVGFGVTSGSKADDGIKRRGDVRIARCTSVPDATHVCWDFRNPLGAAGSDSSTCYGDSGGPLLVQGRVAGVTSGGDSDSCLAPDRPFNADVFAGRAWIRRQAAGDLGTRSCGGLPAAGSQEAPIVSASRRLSGGARRSLHSFRVPAGASRLVVTVNGEVGGSVTADFELAVDDRSAQPTLAGARCSSRQGGVFESCTIDAPSPGTWTALVERAAGSGVFQLTATVFGGTGGGAGGGGGGGPATDPPAACTPGATTLCLDDRPGDRRFRAEVSFRLDGGAQKAAAIPLDSLGVDRGGLFWFFSAENPELLLKVLNGCRSNGRFWVFWSAGTDLGLTVEVTDTRSGAVRTYRNPSGTLARPVGDTAAFSC